MNTFQNHLLAAEAMDWTQVVLNGGPPCFHLCDDGRFCGRAERWDGHEDLHKFVPFKHLMSTLRNIVWREGMEDAQRIIQPQNPSARSPNAEVRSMCMGEIRKAINANNPKRQGKV